MMNNYNVYVVKKACYEIKAESYEQALEIADAWLSERNFDEVRVYDKEWNKEIEVNE